jgi:hypothetical protein
MVGLYRWAGLQRLKGTVSCSAHALAFAFKCSDGSPIDHDKPQAQAARASIVAAALRSGAARRKAATGRTDEGLKVHSFQTLLRDLATIVKNRIQPKDKNIPAFDMLTMPTRLQQQAFDSLGVTLRLN